MKKISAACLGFAFAICCASANEVFTPAPEDVKILGTEGDLAKVLKRDIGFGEGALWKNGNWKLVRNLWKPSWGESYQSIAHRMQDFALEKVAEYPGKQIVVVSHESPIWSYRHMLETGHPEHNMLLRHTALASITSITYDCNTGKIMSITYADPAADVE